MHFVVVALHVFLRCENSRLLQRRNNNYNHHTFAQVSIQPCKQTHALELQLHKRLQKQIGAQCVAMK